MIRRLDAIADVPADDWDALIDPDQPALRHTFLRLLEETGAATPATGWHPAHLVKPGSQGGLSAALPLYEKDHSFGEFVFDFAWADAWQRSGRPYYPKLTAAIPFSPLIGPRLTGHDSASRAALAGHLETLTDGRHYSTAHALFCNEADAALLHDRGWITRQGCRFRWDNQGFRDFDDWLDTFRSKKRKNLRRERRKVREAGFTFRWLEGEELAEVDWESYYPLYAATYWRRMQRPYLPRAFFERLCRWMPENVVLIEARDEAGELTALAFCLRGRHTLYGRHWGATREHDGLHFETCYHQGIEYCIRHGLKYFDPGTQGEHKLLRGFAPVRTRSLHWIPEPGLRRAVADFARAEARQNAAYMAAAREHLPFHRKTAADEAERS
jgi:predicted N-acyltransferase